MSFRKLSMRLKKRRNKLAALEYYKECEEVNEQEQLPEVQRPEHISISKRAWKVLITGGAGHLAEHLVAKLEELTRDEMRDEVTAELEKKQNADPTIMTEAVKKQKKHQMMSRIDHEIENRLPSRIQIVLVDIIQPEAKMGKHHVTFVRGSFDDERVMKTALEKVDTVYHLAAVGMTGQYARDRKACLDINSVGTMNLLTWSKNAGVQRFIYTSSIGVVFNGKSLVNAKEGIPYPDNWYNFYCESKAHAEIIVVKASCEQMKTTILRFNGIYGPGEKRVTERVVNFMISGWWVATCRPNGIEAQTQLSSVDNCVQGLVKAELALRPSDSPQGQVYTIVDRHPVGTFSFWAPLNRALGFTDQMLEVPRVVLRVCAFVSQTIAGWIKMDPLVSLLEVDLLTVNNTFSIARAERELGYEPYPSPMPEIIEMYTRNMPTMNFRVQQGKNFYMKWCFIIFGALGIMILIQYTLFFLYSVGYSIHSFFHWIFEFFAYLFFVCQRFLFG